MKGADDSSCVDVVDETLCDAKEKRKNGELQVV